MYQTEIVQFLKTSCLSRWTKHREGNMMFSLATPPWAGLILSSSTEAILISVSLYGVLCQMLVPSGSTSYCFTEKLCFCTLKPKGRVRQQDSRCLRAEQPTSVRICHHSGSLKPEEIVSAQSQIHSRYQFWIKMISGSDRPAQVSI